MARAFAYANRDDFKTWLQGIGTGTTTHNAVYDAIIQAVSKQIDRYCQREFHPYTATKYFTADRSAYLRLDDDLLSITTLKTTDTEQSGARTYGNTWSSTTDYDLEPYNAPDEETPYTLIRARGTGTYTFPAGLSKAVEIAGTWGYWSQSSLSVGTLGSAISSTTATSVTMAASPTVKPLQTLLIESEQLFVTEVSGTTVTVKRGVNGTTAATHANGTAVTAYEYAGPIVEACRLMTSRIFKRREAPFGISGSAEMGTLQVVAKFDPDIRGLLNDYRRLGIGMA